jgi:undecaprenyl-diphosphatase
MLEVGIALVASVLVGLLWAVAVHAFPRADPAATASEKIGTALAEKAPRSFWRSRLDPEAVTGLALTCAMVAVIVVGTVFGVFAAMIRRQTGVVRLDVSITRWAAAHASDLSLRFFDVVTWAGSTLVIVIVCLAVAIFAIRRWRRLDVILFLTLIVVGQFLLSNAVKVLVERTRPDAAPFRLVAGPSFPSGHATAAAATYAALALVLGRGRSVRARAILAGVGAGIAVVVACSRVFLGAHWTSDVVGGLLLGWTWFALCAVAFGGRVLRLGQPAAEAQVASAETSAIDRGLARATSKPNRPPP